MNEEELKKRSITFAEIVDKQCEYSCYLGENIATIPRPQKPNQTEQFISLKDIDEAKKDFPFTIKLQHHEVIDGNQNIPLFRNRNEILFWLKKWFSEQK